MKLRLITFLFALIWTAGAHAEVVEYVHTDALGSPVAITNESAQVIERTDYDPYGNVIGKSNDDRPGYTGHVMDSATGLTYAQQRYYDTAIGGFLSVDPVVVDATNGANFCRYCYANNSPYHFTDPDGRRPAAFGEIDLNSPYTQAGSVWFSQGSPNGQSNGDSSPRYSPNKPGWHEYWEGPNTVCLARLACTEDEMKDFASRFAVPGQDPSKPVKDGSINKVYDPRTNMYSGKVTTDIGNNGLKITNTTLPGHIFYDGRIDRYFVRMRDGSWVAITHGYGNNVVLGGATLNKWQGPKIFHTVDMQMKAYIEAIKGP